MDIEFKVDIEHMEILVEGIYDVQDAIEDISP